MKIEEGVVHAVKQWVLVTLREKPRTHKPPQQSAPDGEDEDQVKCYASPQRLAAARPLITRTPGTKVNSLLRWRGMEGGRWQGRVKSSWEDQSSTVRNGDGGAASEAGLVICFAARALPACLLRHRLTSVWEPRRFPRQAAPGDGDQHEVLSPGHSNPSFLAWFLLSPSLVFSTRRQPPGPPARDRRQDTMQMTARVSHL